MAEKPAAGKSGVETTSGGKIAVEIVYGDAARQVLRKVEIAANSTIVEAIAASGIEADLPPGFVPAAFGIFGRVVTGETRLQAGDRIELYRPLLADPKESRRRRAAR